MIISKDMIGINDKKEKKKKTKLETEESFLDQIKGI